MRRSLLAFGAALGVSYAMAASSSGCYQAADDCNCQPTPERPEPGEPLSKLRVTGSDAMGRLAPTVVAPAQGALEVLGDRVLITYQQDGVQYNVTYDVTGRVW